ncbi:MAG TPA: hypothetical protein VGV88_14510 [Candidatus Dormibacteraeota bacterium]|nr:hypothetical protein [Candidatus Dormibacteraeota bacterium]
MNEFYNEEMAWRQLQDLQLEMENRRLVASGGRSLRWWLPRLADRVWVVAGLASRRAPRWSPALVEGTAAARREERRAGTDAA